MAKKENTEVLTIEGREVRITNPDKPYFSRDVKLSKLGVVHYYLSVASGAVAGIRDRPSMLKAAEAAKRAKRAKVPLIVVANSPDKEAALAGLERWKTKHPGAASNLAVDDVLVDSMRGRSSTWTRIRVNLRNVPEELRPPQETPHPDDDPTRAWREARGKGR